MSIENINLGNDLVLHPVRDAKDAAGFIALNEAVTGEGYICQRLMDHHPSTNRDDYFVVEDLNSGEIISTTCFIPWQLLYDGVSLNAAMLEMVVTHPRYRHRGLVRAQVNHFHSIAEEKHCDLCIIQGVPYFYRQFGYSYVLDHTPVEVLSSDAISQAASSLPPAYSFRLATVLDAGMLHRLYVDHMHQHGVYVQRDEAYWRYLLQDARYPVQVIEDIYTHQMVGYVCIDVAGGDHTSVKESVVQNHEQALEVLTWIKATKECDIYIVGSENTILVQVARNLGSRRRSTDQWLVRVPNFQRLLRSLGPIFEHRIAHTFCASFTDELIINLYRKAFQLTFARGKLQAVENMGFIDTSIGSCAGGGDMWIPPAAFIRLLFGYRTLDQLMDAWPDIVVKNDKHPIWDVLFPQMDSLILMPY